MVVPITDIVNMSLSVADISVELIIGTPLVLSMHFNWFFTAKANFKVCIEMQNILVTIFSMSIPTIKYYHT